LHDTADREPFRRKAIQRITRKTRGVQTERVERGKQLFRCLKREFRRRDLACASSETPPGEPAGYCREIRPG